MQSNKTYFQQIPETFIDQVKEALEHLYDLPFLQRHPLTLMLFDPIDRGNTAGQTLRRKLINTIEALSPEIDNADWYPKNRSGNLLRMHFIEGMTVQEMALECALSTRQVYRDLHNGQEHAAALLWNEYIQAKRRNAPVFLAEEPLLNHMGDSTAETDILSLVNQARKTVQQLALQREVEIIPGYADIPVSISTNATTAQQLIISILSWCIKQSAKGDLWIYLQEQEEAIFLSFTYSPAAGISPEHHFSSSIDTLAVLSGWDVSLAAVQDDRRTAILSIPTSYRVILIIDDNEGLEQLISRYLAGFRFRLVGARSGKEGLQLASQLNPAAIVLDIMMPEIDGWELAQRLKSRAETASIPIIICSAFSDPELAFSLGIHQCLSKPLERKELIHALHETGVL